MEIRLQKILARAGIGSRRFCEKLILDGRITVNHDIAKIGMKADPDRDRILLDGKPILAREKTVYLVLNKPRGVISASKTNTAQTTVRDLVPVDGHLFPVGRLDIDSEGLILLTNDGELTNLLTHPRYQHEKEYKVLVSRIPDEKQLRAWRRGVVLETGYKTKPASVQIINTNKNKTAWLSVVLREGKKRQIREMGRLTGLPVIRIIRIRIGNLRLGKLKPGSWRTLTAKEIDALILSTKKR